MKKVTTNEQGKEKRHRQPMAKKRLKRLAILLALLLIALGVTGYYYAHKFEGNIKTEKSITPEKARPIVLPEVKGAINILLMGSDDRTGTNIKGETPGLSDTTILLHLSEDRDFAYGISIPRDTMVTRPPCPRKTGGGVDPGGLTQFNAAFAVGGPACTVATVEAITKVRVNNFVVVNFNGFKNVVNALGGITMCVPKPINDSIGHIKLKAGTYNMNGNTALDYVRVRHGVGNRDLGDIGRMKRQQVFIAAVIDKVMAAGTLANPIKIINLLDATTSSLTTDPEFADLRKLAGLASSLKNIGLDSITFETAPFVSYPLDPNRVILAPEAEAVWDSMRHDRPLHEPATPATPTPSPQAEASVPPTPTESPSVIEEQDAAPKDKKTLTPAEKAAFGLC